MTEERLSPAILFVEERKNHQGTRAIQSKEYHMPKLKTLTLDKIHSLKLGSITEFDDCHDLDVLANDNYRAIDEAHVTKLAQSIKEAGLKTEVSLVVKVAPDGERRCVIEDGHHRVQAVRTLRDRAKQTGNAWLSRPLPCRVKVVLAESQQNNTAVDSVIKNQLTKEETIWDKADAYKRLRDSGESTPSISVMTGVDERTVRRALSLLRIPPDVRAFAEANLDSVKVASLYRLASALAADGATNSGAEKSVEDLLRKKTSDKSGRERPAVAAAAKKDIKNWAAAKGLKAMEEPHLAMAAYLALDFLPVGGDLDPEGAEENSQTAKAASSDATVEGGGRRQQPKAETREKAPRPRDSNPNRTPSGGHAARPEDEKKRWRDDVLTQIAELGLSRETYEAVRAVILKSS